MDSYQEEQAARRAKQALQEAAEKRRNFMKKVLYGGIAAVVMLLMSALLMFKTIVTEPGWVSVLIDKPWLFGSEGVRNEIVQPGRKWIWRFSTDRWQLVNTPFKIEENFNDLSTSNNNFLDFQTTLTLQYIDHVAIVRDFGVEDSRWYAANLQRQYQQIMRDVVKKFAMESILSGENTINLIEEQVKIRFLDVIKESKVPVKLVDLSLGRPRPNDPVVAEMDKTAIQQQRKKTEAEGAEAEKNRKDREVARAAADSAYRDKLGISTDQFVKLEVAKAYAQACAKSQCIIVDTSNPIVLGAK